MRACQRSGTTSVEPRARPTGNVGGNTSMWERLRFFEFRQSRQQKRSCLSPFLRLAYPSASRPKIFRGFATSRFINDLDNPNGTSWTERERKVVTDAKCCEPRCSQPVWSNTNRQYPRQ